jgi:hypothetical protein
LTSFRFVVLGLADPSACLVPRHRELRPWTTAV